MVSTIAPSVSRSLMFVQYSPSTQKLKPRNRYRGFPFNHDKIHDQDSQTQPNAILEGPQTGRSDKGCHIASQNGYHKDPKHTAPRQFDSGHASVSSCVSTEHELGNFRIEGDIAMSEPAQIAGTVTSVAIATDLESRSLGGVEMEDDVVDRLLNDHNSAEEGQPQHGIDACSKQRGSTISASKEGLDDGQQAEGDEAQMSREEEDELQTASQSQRLSSVPSSNRLEPLAVMHSRATQTYPPPNLQKSTNSASSNRPQEWAVTGFLERKQIGPEELYTLKLPVDFLHYYQPAPTHLDKYSHSITNLESSAMATSDMHSQPISTPGSRPKRTRIKFTQEENELLIDLKERQGLSWPEITCRFPKRSSGTLQAHYSTKLKNGQSSQKRRQRLMKGQQLCERRGPIDLGISTEANIGSLTAGASIEAPLRLRSSRRQRRPTAKAKAAAEAEVGS